MPTLPKRNEGGCKWRMSALMKERRQRMVRVAVKLPVAAAGQKMFLKEV